MSLVLTKRSLYLILGLIITFIVSVIMTMHAHHMYSDTKEKIIIDMKEDAKFTILTLQKSIANLIESYSINEYEKLLQSEMENSDTLAIIIEDLNMGKIVGQPAYITGKMRDKDWNIIDYDVTNIEHTKRLQQGYYKTKFDINSSIGEYIGTITIYTSNRAIELELNEIISNTIKNSIALSLLLIISLNIAIRFFILKPISNIINVISDQDEDGTPKKTIPSDGSVEISLLAKTINKMVDAIRHSRVELIRQQETLNYQANHDYLTGLPNRILLNDRLTQAIKKARKSKSQVGLLMIDLDHFKEINDSLGHEFGDKILKVVTQYLKNTISKSDTLARLGGDEFSIIVEDINTIDDVSTIAQKILDILSKPFHIGSNKLYISSSIGISIFPDDGITTQDLIKYADAAMYKAKEEGRNNFQYYSVEMTEQAQERLTLETNLRVALGNREFVVYYQPQINGRTGELLGMEALVRWNNPTLGIVPPSKFIPLAESTGLIVELDRYVMHTAMRQLVRWYDEGLNPGILAMNLTVKQLQQSDFIKVLNSMLEETQCQAEWLALEVTEGQIMTNPKKAIEILNEIGKLGIELAIDDFGTGYSSLSYLKKLPINKLKVDQSFVRDLPVDEEDIAITKAIIALAKSLNLHILAEGVEREEQKRFLVENGCEAIQGFLYSKPIPAEEMEMFLKSRVQ